MPYGDGPLVERTSSAEAHFELMALINILAAGLGVEAIEGPGDEGEGEDWTPGVAAEPYLPQIRDQLGEIKDLLGQSLAASGALQAEAQAILDTHAQSASQYFQDLEQPDYYPFADMPSGTDARDLPDGGRLFTLPDGVFLRANPDGIIFAVMEDGYAAKLEPALGGVVALPDGREFTLVQEAILATHEVAGIEGLPLDIEPVQVANGRFSLNLPGGIRLEVSHPDRLAMVINPLGTVVVLSASRIEGLGEEVSARTVPGGARAFISLESNHQGVIEADGTIHAALSNGLDLVIRFPDEDGDQSSEGPDSPEKICEERE